jgi:hypothetical protein
MSKTARNTRCPVDGCGRWNNRWPKRDPCHPLPPAGVPCPPTCWRAIPSHCWRVHPRTPSWVGCRPCQRPHLPCVLERSVGRIKSLDGRTWAPGVAFDLLVEAAGEHDHTPPPDRPPAAPVSAAVHCAATRCPPSSPGPSRHWRPAGHVRCIQRLTIVYNYTPGCRVVYNCRQLCTDNCVQWQ